MLEIDAAEVAEAITRQIAVQVGRVLRRQGVVVETIGGAESAVCIALAARALGPDRVLGIMMIDRESDDWGRDAVERWAREIGITYLTEDLSPALDLLGYYRGKDDAVRATFPEFGEGWKCRGVFSEEPGTTTDPDLLNLALEDPDGRPHTFPVSSAQFRRIAAVTNSQQRLRIMIEYQHSDRLDYAVLGTATLVDREFGYWVKGGAGSADLLPIAHLYPSQVRQLADFLGIPDEITSTKVTPDVLPLEQSHRRSFLRLPQQAVDRLISVLREGVPDPAAAAGVDLPADLARAALGRIRHQLEATNHLHYPPLLIDHFS